MNEQAPPIQHGPQVLTFPFSIPSVAQKNPGMPGPILGLLDLNRRIQPGQQLDYAQVKHAKASAEALKNIHDVGNNPNITERMVNSACARAVAVESSYSSAEYSPQDFGQRLMQIHDRLQEIGTRVGDIDVRTEGMDERSDAMALRIEQMDQNLRVALASSANTKIISRNTRVQAPNLLHPLQKTVPKNGLTLVIPLLNDLEQEQRQNFLNTHLPNAPIAVIGSTPPNFDPYLDSYDPLDILQMIFFYNESFGIVVQDPHKDRVLKFRRFLSEF